MSVMLFGFHAEEFLEAGEEVPECPLAILTDIDLVCPAQELVEELQVKCSDAFDPTGGRIAD
ncbi:MAG: hypothetical protein ABIF71_14540 [Planctomycetota bacterium]